ncbi:uroporphyrinogen-III synthase [Shewanella dokdonensis]|uniref:Uroporphyrinogen-III synthase n=1 Tax=Shewanella dokdonensis TaxID=712036 RepID=A0ABX8DK03_9GAMM|nr:uroporphyrinogen-III synthase [Shewanella dokdonensis]MCL1075973.1 uroporphyrinogen-III synthase [Shewanella dokdonensis]QVK24282.1 uroporphyrinogen-III synthase [Shewanella dokdonensis]
MKVLLTRPQGRNQSMEDALHQQGIAFMTTPLLAVEPLNDQQGLAQLHDADIVIFISTNAVEFANQLVGNHWPADKHYLAVGEATCQAVKDLGIEVQSAPTESQQTEGLLTLALLQPDQVTQRHILIIRGQGGREDLGDVLRQRGAQLDYWEVYRRVCPAYNAQQLLQSWQAFGIDTILITSGDILKNLLKLLPKEYFPWLRACHIIVPSTRVERQALAAGLSHVTNACAANSQAMLNALAL